MVEGGIKLLYATHRKAKQWPTEIIHNDSSDFLWQIAVSVKLVEKPNRFFSINLTHDSLQLKNAHRTTFWQAQQSPIVMKPNKLS